MDNEVVIKNLSSFLKRIGQDLEGLRRGQRGIEAMLARIDRKMDRLLGSKGLGPDRISDENARELQRLRGLVDTPAHREFVDEAKAEAEREFQKRMTDDGWTSTGDGWWIKDEFHVVDRPEETFDSLLAEHVASKLGEGGASSLAADLFWEQAQRHGLRPGHKLASDAHAAAMASLEKAGELLANERDGGDVA